MVKVNFGGFIERLFNTPEKQKRLEERRKQQQYEVAPFIDNPENSRQISGAINQRDTFKTGNVAELKALLMQKLASGDDQGIDAIRARITELNGWNIGGKISKLHGEGYKAPGQAYAIAKSMGYNTGCLLYTSPSPRDRTRSRMPSSA